MTSVIPVEGFVEALLEGLKERNLSFAVSRGMLGRQLVEVFMEEARELILIPESVLSRDSIRWILEMRTPIKIRLTVFTNQVTEYKLRIMRAVSDLRENGLAIPNVEDAISIQEPSSRNLVRLLESLENWHDLKASGRPLPQGVCTNTTPTTTRHSAGVVCRQAEANPRLERALTARHDGSSEVHADLYIQLRNGIKTYWTERYLARFLRLSAEKARETAERIGVGREVCGQEVLYFFDRTTALKTYFIHLLKGILEEMGIRYEEGPNQAFLLPESNLALVFFDGDREQLQVLADDYARSHDLIFVVPEQLRITIGRIQDDFFRVIPLARNHIVNALRGLAQKNSWHHKAAFQAR